MNCKYTFHFLPNGSKQIIRQSVNEDAMRQFLFSNSTRTKSKCWEWDGYKSPSGYGVTRYRNKIYRAHRLSWLLYRGPIPAKREVCHHCDNPSCCNPNHLFLGTHKDNMQDARFKKRLRSNKGEDHGCSKLLEAQVLEIRKRYKPKIVTRQMLADEYGVSLSLIGQIVDGYIWKHVG